MSDEPHFEGFGIPIPPALINALSQSHDRANMTAEALAARIDNFISSLDVEGLLALRAILNTGDLSNSNSANFYDGQLVAILKFVKHVDPESGKDPLAIEKTP